MERPDFFTLKNGEKVKLPFSPKEYQDRVDKIRKVMSENDIEITILTSMHNIAYYTVNKLIYSIISYINLVLQLLFIIILLINIIILC